MRRVEPRFLHAGEGNVILVRVAVQDGNTLLECDEPGPFLSRLYPDRPVRDFPPHTCLRGVVFAGNGAVFQLFDAFGTASDELKLSAQAAGELLQEIG